MTWQQIATISPIAEWTLTPEVSGNLFKLEFVTASTNAKGFRAVVSQFFQDGEEAYYLYADTVTHKREKQLLQIIKPRGLSQRRLAIRRLDSLIDAWTINLSVFENSEVLDLPINITDVLNLQDLLNSKVAEETLASHIAETNPHQTTYQDVGAEPLGAAALAAVEAVSQHINQVDPHSQYATDADLNAHTTNTNNPHNVTVDQIGAEVAGTAAAVFGSLGNSATRNVGTSAETVAAGDDPRFSGNLKAASNLGDLASLPQARINLGVSLLPVGASIDYEGLIDSTGILIEDNLIWLLLDGKSIGNATSGATRYASPKAEPLFNKLWYNGNLNIFDASGSAASRGASPDADFNANKRLLLPDVRCRSIIYAGNPNGFTVRVWGARGGAETHVNTLNQTPLHDHPAGYKLAGTEAAAGTGFANPGTYTARVIMAESGTGGMISTGGVGSGAAHNNMQPFYVSNAKLILVGKNT